MATALVIFDCDGVLVDSELAGNRVLRDVIAEQGWELTLQETLHRFKGRSMADVWHEVGEQVGREVSPAVYDDFRSRQFEVLRREVKCVPGIETLLQSLQAPYCVASNGPHAKMRATLGATGLLPHFEGRIFSRMDVARPKPHPDLFLHAASTLGASPACCVVVEDSPLGIEAARAAGMRAIGFAGTATADAPALEAAGAETVLRELSVLPALL